MVRARKQTDTPSDQGQGVAQRRCKTASTPAVAAPKTGECSGERWATHGRHACMAARARGQLAGTSLTASHEKRGWRLRLMPTKKPHSDTSTDMTAYLHAFGEATRDLVAAGSAEGLRRPKTRETKAAVHPCKGRQGTTVDPRRARCAPLCGAVVVAPVNQPGQADDDAGPGGAHHGAQQAVEAALPDAS